MATTTADTAIDSPPVGRRWVRPALRRELALAIGLVTIGTLVPALLGLEFWAQTMLLVDLFLIATVGLNILIAEAGQISFGQGVIFGVAAYSSGMMMGIAGTGFLLAAIVGLLAGLAVGFVMALPALRVQSYYLGFVTMAAALAFPQVLFIFADQTQATTGISVFPSGFDTVLAPGITVLTVVMIVVASLALAGNALIRSSKFGRDMRMTGHSTEAASTLGMSPGRMRMAAFLVASLLGSIGGVLYLPVIGYAAPSSFTIDLSITFFLAVVVGGSGTIIGPLVGLVVVYLLPNALLAGFEEYRLIIFGVVAFAVMYVMPDGIVGFVKKHLAIRRGGGGGTAVDMERLVAAVVAAGGDDRRGGPALEVDGVTKSFGSVQALAGATLSIRPGEIHGIVGPNGSGKTSLLNILSGLYVADSGRVLLDGTDITRTSVIQRARLGLGRTFQTPRVIDTLSAWENTDLGHPGRDSDLGMRDIVVTQRAAWDATAASTLSHAQRRFLEVARVMNLGARLWLLDEPAAGLSQTERREFGAMLRAVCDTWGTTIVIVEHDLELVWSLVDTVSVVSAGKVIAGGTPTEIDARDDVRHIFQGVHHVDD